MDRKDRKTRKLKRQESLTGKSIKPCSSFKPNVWKPTKCVNCFFPAEQHASSSSDHVDVNPVELKRLQELLDAGMIQPAEFERRKALLKSTGVLTRM